MDLRRSILYFVLAVLGVMLFHAWQQDYPVQLEQQTAEIQQGSSNQQHPVDFAPSSNENVSNYQATPKTLSTAIPSDKMINVKTDLLDADINLRDGNLVNVKLLQYPVSLKEKNNPVQILNSNNEKLYVTQSGLSVSDKKTPRSPIVYTATQNNYVLKDGQNKLMVTLTGKTAQNILITKTFTFTRGQYPITTTIQLTNDSGVAWTGNIYNQITRRNVTETHRFGSRAYNGAAVSTPNTPYKKLTYATLSESDFSREMQNGWIAMQQHYFITTWIPSHNEMLHYYSRAFGNEDDGANNIFILGYLSPSIHLAPKSTATFSSTLYVGPEIAKNLETLGKGLGLTVDYGWLWPISKFLFWLMSEIEHYVGNWGWSIIIVTLLIKVAFYGLSKKSYSSMAKTRDLQPKIQLLKDRHGSDKQAMSKAMMELYRKEKINPLGGCLPMLIQIPVFFALYYVLIESVELRQAPFIFWIQDLSVKDPYYVLPLLMGISMFFQQKLSPPPPDPVQAKMMMFLPVMMTIFFLTFPAGLVLYWLTNNCASILQQWFVMKMHEVEKQKRIVKTKS